jgi:tRNA threonylcarbamoyladenosine biosynthesis protein TsaB
MRLLGIETSTLVGGVALLDDDVVVAESSLNVATTHSERLLAAVHRLLEESNAPLASLDGLAVAVGPGSFTGLRIGIATAKGLAFASGLPLVGVPTLDALAWGVPFATYPVCPLLDAKKGEVYTALYRHRQGDLERLTDYRVLSPDRLLSELEGPVCFLGDGLLAYRDRIVAAMGDRAHFVPPPRRYPSGACVADLGARRLAAGGVGDPATVVPLYVRPSEAELAKARHAARD